LKITTSRFGDVEIQDSEVITIPYGLMGFSELNQFVLLDHHVDSPFKWLQSLDDGQMAFVLISPLTFRPNYTIQVSKDDIKTLGLTNPQDSVISVIVTIPVDARRMSANLKAPLVFNLKNKVGKQVVVKDFTYQTKHYILEEIKKNVRPDHLNSLCGS